MKIISRHSSISIKYTLLCLSRAEIRRLTELLNGTFARHSGQDVDLSEVNEHTPNILDETHSHAK
jgi:hypothetical protein